MLQLNGKITIAITPKDDQIKDKAIVTPPEEDGEKTTIDLIIEYISRCQQEKKATARTTTEDMILEYMKELGIGNYADAPKSDFALYQTNCLISSHRSLRAENKRSQADKIAEMEKAMANARQHVLDTEYVKVEDLRSMTLQEITARIGVE